MPGTNRTYGTDAERRSSAVTKGPTMLSTHHGRRHGAALAGFAVATLLLTGCSGDTKDGSGGGTSADGEVTFVAYTGQAGDYQINFNPFSPSNIGGGGTIYEPLFFLNKARVADPEPLLGTEQSWNDDGTVFSVTLREGVKWSDGEAFDADDVAFTFQMLKDNAAINNMGFEGEIVKVDGTHVEFHFDTPAFVKGPDILNQEIVPEHIWKNIDPAEDIVEKPVGTGAFKLNDFKPQAFTFVANPDYWGGKPKIDKIRWLSLSGNQAGADAIAAGTIDWQTGPIPDIQNTHKNFPSYDAYTQWQNQVVLATCSSADMGCTGPQTDPAVRRAIYHAVDRTQLNNLAFMGTANDISPTFALTPSQDSFVSADITDKVASSTADPAKAAATLEGAGWAKGSDGIYAKGGERLSLTVEVVTGWTDYITAVDTISSQAKAAGIEITGAQSSWNEWTEKRFSGNFELAIDSLWQGPAPDPYYLYNYFFASGSGAKVGENAGNNYSRFADDSVDTALDELAKLPLDDPSRQGHFDTIQKVLVEEMPYIPIVTGGTTSVWNTAKFQGWPSDDDLYAFPAVWSRLDAAQIYKRIEPLS